MRSNSFSPLQEDDGSQAERWQWHGSPQYAPTPGNFGHTPSSPSHLSFIGTSPTTPAELPPPHPNPSRTDKLPLLQYRDWVEGKAYDEDPPTCIHYWIEWKVTLNNRTVVKDTEQDLVLAPRFYCWCSYIAASEKRTVQLYELSLVSVGYMVPSQYDRDYARLQQRLLPHANYLIQRERNNWPDDTMAVLQAFHGLGGLYHDQGKLKDAEEMYQQALAGFEKALGPGHSKTRMVSESLATLATFGAERPRKRDTLYKILRRK
ncbi:hypothetical protein BJX66DRAFT_345772 [Aspergillus keveii]|uniref:Uncharacterized protein n=1 Tax=Aspergillus keveii TaxID=714993 RepID=A0ABR4FGY7_9EURO